MQLRRILFCLVVVAAAGLACSSLGLGQDPTPTPVPTTDLPTPVVPTLTHTPEPTATFTPEPTLTPSPEPTEEPIADSSTFEYWVNVQDDGTSIFTDRVLGYQLVFGPEWYVLPMDKDMEDYLYAAAGEGLSEELAQIIEATRDQVGIRMLALDQGLAYSPSFQNITNVSAVYQEDAALAGMDLGFLIQANAEVLPSLFPNAVVSEVDVHTNQNGIEYGRLVISHPAEWMGFEMTQVMIMIQLEKGIMIMTCTAAEETFPTVAPVFQQIVDSLERVVAE